MKVGLPLFLTTVATHQYMVQNSVLPACACEDNLNDGSTCLVATCCVLTSEYRMVVSQVMGSKRSP